MKLFLSFIVNKVIINFKLNSKGEKIIIEGILMIIIGELAAMSLITAVSKDSKKILDVIVPFQGYLGIVVLCWGIWGIISALLGLSWIAQWPIWWITLLAISIVEVVIGFILGFSLISKYALSKNEEAKKKAEELLAKLSPYKITLGLIGIGVGVWSIIYKLIIVQIIKM